MPKVCNHTNTVNWFSNTGNLADESSGGTRMYVQCPDGPIPYLTLCTVCGVTFAAGTDKDNRRRTAATLRELEALADE